MSWRQDVLDELRNISSKLAEIMKNTDQPSPSNVSEAMDILVRTGRKNGPIELPPMLMQRPTAEGLESIPEQQLTPEYSIGAPVWVRRKIGDALVNQPGKPGVMISDDTFRGTKRYRVATTTGLVTVDTSRTWQRSGGERNVLSPRTVEVGEPVIVYRAGNPNEPGHDDIEGVGWIASVNREGREWAVAWGWHRGWENTDGTPRIVSTRTMCSRYSDGARARVIPRGNHDRAPAQHPTMDFSAYTNRWLGDDGRKGPRHLLNDRVWVNFGSSGYHPRATRVMDVGYLFDDGSAGSYWVLDTFVGDDGTGFPVVEVSAAVVHPESHREGWDGPGCLGEPNREGEAITIATHTWYRLPGTDVELCHRYGHNQTLRYRTVTAGPTTVQGQDAKFAKLPTEVYDALELLARRGRQYGISVQMSNRVTSQPTPSFTIPQED